MPNRRAASTKRCAACDTPFPLSEEIDGVRVYHHKRKYCTVCSPYGSGNRRILERAAWTEKTCSECMLLKPLSEFFKRKRGDYKPSCKDCHGAKGTALRRKYKAQAVAYKGGSCQDCGYQRHQAALEFHHLDPSQKEFTFGTVGRSFDTIREELDKCKMLCGNCHREEHERLDDLDAQAAWEADLVNVDPSGPSCTQCGLHKKESAFTVKKGRPGSWCRACFRKYQRENRLEIKQEIIDYKGGCCTSCSYSKSAAALELHHRDHTQKDFSLSELRKRLPLVLEEVDKCILLCTNCHTETHAVFGL